MFPVLIPYSSSVPLFYVSFSLICEVLHTPPCLLVLCLCLFLYSFLFLSKFSISVSSILFLIVDFCVLFCIVSVGSFRILFIYSIDGSSSFRVPNLFFSSILKGVANFSNTLRFNLSGFCF